jgi:glycerol-3-phosphate cytidylyltransferase-like family protein
MLKTWTYKNENTAVVVTADDVDLAIQLIERKLNSIGIYQKIERTQLIPCPTHHRYVRIINHDK